MQSYGGNDRDKDNGKITRSIAGIAQQVQKWSHQVSVILCVQHSGFGSFQDLFGATWSELD